MRLISIGDPGQETAAVYTEDGIAVLAEVRPTWPTSWRGVLSRFGAEGAEAFRDSLRVCVSEAKERGDAAWRKPDSVRLGPPIPDPSKIVAVGLNYRDHAEEQNKQPPEQPLLFAKAPTCLIGPRDTIELPPTEVEDRVDAEAELCVVVGRTLKAATESEAADAVAGYTIMNDVSGRAAQYGDRQWFRGKSFDTFGPCGPWVVTVDELSDPHGLALEADWNDRAMQRGTTSNLIFRVPGLLSYISRSMTLLPGDLVATGTPSGVGVFRDPPVFLRDGDVVTIRLEKVGELRNPVRRTRS